MTVIAESYVGAVLWFAAKTLTVLMAAVSVLGLLLIFMPALLYKWNQKLYSPTSMRKPLKPLEIPRETETWLERNRVTVGSVFLVGAIYMLYHFAFSISCEDLSRFSAIWFSTQHGMFFSEIIFTVAKITFVLWGLFGVIVLILFSFFPKRYQSLSTTMNRWISSRLMIMPLEEERYVEGSIFFRHHLLFGSLVVLGSLYSLWALSSLPEYFAF
jgi:hypothetical protein